MISSSLQRPRRCLTYSSFQLQVKTCAQAERDFPELHGFAPGTLFGLLPTAGARLVAAADAEYAARMEAVFDLYGEAPGPRRPLVCCDETAVQLLGEARMALQPGTHGKLIQRIPCDHMAPHAF